MTTDGCIDLIFTVDDNYAEAFLAAVLSLAASTDGNPRLNIISTQGSLNLKKTIGLIERLGLPYRVRSTADVDKFFTRRPTPREKFTFDAHYYRLFASDLFPDVRRAIYLDSDLIVRRGLRALWEVDLAGNIVAAVADPSFLGPEDNEFRAAYGGSYFNSGVMLVDLVQWRTDQIGPEVAQWISRYEKQEHSGAWRQFWDQSPLNRALQDRWLPLNPSWNCTIRTNANQASAYGLAHDEMLSVLEEPFIYHFLGGEKPWKAEYARINKYFLEYQAYSLLAQRLCSTTDRLRSVAVERPTPASSEQLDFARVAARLFRELSNKISPVSFVQVGAHDGIAGDPIHVFIREFGWRGLLIEPVPYLFEQLQRNYKGIPGLIFENLCVAPDEGKSTFYYMRHQDPPPVGWYSQLSSFRRDVILTHKNDIPGIENFIEEMAIETKRLETLVLQHQVRVDALIVDTEGFDAKVLSSIDLIKHDPFIVYFEYKHLPPKEAVDVVERLKRLRYVVLTDRTNVIAVNPVLLPEALLAEILGSSAGSLEAL